MKPEDYVYIIKNNICFFQKGPLSQWWGGFKGQTGGFSHSISNAFPEGYLSAEMYKHLYDTYPNWSIEFNCCEQYMMAAKAAIFNDLETFKKIMSTKSPQQQKDLGREVKKFSPSLWDGLKFSVVYKANLLKFTQNSELQAFLKSFNHHTIFAEASPWDKIWGIGMDGNDPRSSDVNTWDGENLLGKAITMVRDNIIYVK